MSQHDYNIANQSGAAFRADLNLLLMSILSQNSGVTPPTTTTPYMLWADTANNMLRMRNAANNGWVWLGTLDSFALTSVQRQTATYFTTGGTSTNFTLTPVPAVSTLTIGTRFRVTFHVAPTGTPYLTVAGTAGQVLAYRDRNGTKQMLTATQCPAGWTADVEFDGYNWVLLNIPQPANAWETLVTLTSVDGHGSGLDADSLDGYHAASFQLAGTGINRNFSWELVHSLAQPSGWSISTVNLTGNWGHGVYLITKNVVNWMRAVVITSGDGQTIDYSDIVNSTYVGVVNCADQAKVMYGDSGYGSIYFYKLKKEA